VPYQLLLSLLLLLQLHCCCSQGS